VLGGEVSNPSQFAYQLCRTHGSSLELPVLPGGTQQHGLGTALGCGRRDL